MRKATAIAALLAIGLRLASFLGVDKKAGDWVLDFVSDGKLVSASLRLELGHDPMAQTAAEAGGHTETEAPYSSNNPPAGLPEAGPSPSVSPSVSPSPSSGPPGADGEETPEILPTKIFGGLTISNDTSFEPDIPALMEAGLSQTLPASGPQILIIHTHGSEAYTPDDKDIYEGSKDARTQDTNYNVVRVGDELKAALEQHGLNVIHDRGIYDYPSYAESYRRSLAAIESYLAQYPDIAVVIDLHRDAIGTGDVIYKTMAEISGESSAQIMLLVGTGENGLSHPEWKENLKLGLQLQSAVSQKYSSLARPLALKQERYNQHLTTGSLILEVGSSGNTLQEALCAVRLFADAAGPFFSGLVAN